MSLRATCPLVHACSAPQALGALSDHPELLTRAAKNVGDRRGGPPGAVLACRGSRAINGLKLWLRWLAR